MGIACWQAAADGRYWIDVVVGNMDLRAMIDLGMVDPLHQIGFEIEPSIYDQLKQTGQLTNYRKRSRRDASGRSLHTESGRTTAQLLDPLNRKPIGPACQLYTSRGNPGLPSRVGVVFFHNLTGCKVIWELNNRDWSIEY